MPTMTQRAQIDWPAIARAAEAALRRNEAPQAAAMISEAIASEANSAPATAWRLLAAARRAMSDSAGAAQALDEALVRDPRNLPAWLDRGELAERLSDRRALTRAYGQALKLAQAQGAGAEAARLRHAQDVLAQAAKGYEAHLLERMNAFGYQEAEAPPRFRESLDLLLGKRQVFLQQPRFFYYPGLPQLQFYPRPSCPWLDPVEAAFADIRKDLDALRSANAAFQPYVEAPQGQPARGLAGNPDWGALYIEKNGAPQPDAAACPSVTRALAGAPLCRIASRSPSILFSRLAPGARIPPHHGFVNTRLICHLGLVTPKGCGFRVGNETRPWREGEAFAFDDTIEHEAWNGAGSERIVLLFDVWRPELDADERALITALFAAIDAYGAGPSSWAD